jgi:hypothetical protein
VASIIPRAENAGSPFSQRNPSSQVLPQRAKLFPAYAMIEINYGFDINDESLLACVWTLPPERG